MGEYRDPFPMRAKPTSWKPRLRPLYALQGGPVTGWQCTLLDGTQRYGATPYAAWWHAVRASNSHRARHNRPLLLLP